MNDLREMIEHAFAVDDLARADYERWQWSRSQRQNEELVYKTFAPQQQPQPSRTMDAETRATWNQWCDTRIRAYVEGVVELLGEECGIENRKLRDEIAELRSDLEVLRSGNVTTMVRQRDVA